MEWVLVALVVLGIWIYSRSRSLNGAHGVESRRPDRQISREDLAGVKRAADEDVTEFGEELQRLDSDLGGRELDEGTRADYQRALDAYEDAKASAAAVTSGDEIRHVTEILGDGRYDVACVRARVEGKPLPARRPPCFFNPQHGPSSRDVSWAPERGARRDVPACDLDAQRVEQGAEPDSRKVMLGARRVPYWQAGPAYAPWTAGYFASFGIMEMMFVGTMMGMAFGGFDGSYDQGYEDGQDSGSADGSEGSSDGGSDNNAGGDVSGDASGDGGGWDGGADGGGFDGGWGGGGFDGGGDFGGF